MLNSVRIGNKDLYTDFGCILAHVEIGAPTVQTKFVQVPLRNGPLDFTELLTDEVKYNDREIKIDLLYQGKNLIMVQSDIENYLHGQRFEIVFDEDISYFYIGRLEVENYEVTNYGGKIHLKGTCDPFKYSITSSDEDWLWDPFDFEEGYINELGNITITGSKIVVIIGDKKPSYPTVTTNAQMTVTKGTLSVTISTGTTTLYDFPLGEGDNTLTFTGTGTISIKYRGARL